MQNRFGLKDFVMLVLVLGIGVSMWLAMFQRDREWSEIQTVKQKLVDLEGHLARMEATLDRGIVMAAPGEGGGPAQAAAPRDESWARPGVPVEWQPAWTYATDPRDQPGYRVGGEFTETFEVQPAKLTPYILTDVYGRRVQDLVTETLGVYDPKTLKLRGLLAEAWQADPSGEWLRVRIRANARFSDGQPVTAEDVRWTFHDFVMNPQIEAERSRSIVADVIDRVEAIDDKTVEFHFKDVFFSNRDSALSLYILPKHFYSRFSPAEINQATGLLLGSGPYRIENLNPDRQWSPPAAVVLVRNQQYWGPRPAIERLRFKAITDELARLTDYRNGDSDMVTPSAPQFVESQRDAVWLANNHNLNWVNMRSGRAGIIWNCGPRNGRLTPFHDARVRNAMTHLLDREKMIQDIWRGIGEVASGFFNPGTIGHDPDLKPLPYDLNRARQLLKEAGWEDRNRNGVLEDPNGNEFIFELTYFGGGEIAERIALFIKDSCAAVGIRCNLRAMDWSVGEPVRNQRDFDAMIMGWGASAPESDPKQIFHSESIQNQGDNFGQWSNAAADRAIDLARKELDDAKREQHWRDFARAMHEDQPYTWVRVSPYIRFVKKDVGNIQTYPKGLELWEFFRGRAAEPQAVR